MPIEHDCSVARTRLVRSVRVSHCAYRCRMQALPGELHPLRRTLPLVRRGPTDRLREERPKLHWPCYYSCYYSLHWHWHHLSPVQRRSYREANIGANLPERRRRRRRRTRRSQLRSSAIHNETLLLLQDDVARSPSFVAHRGSRVHLRPRCLSLYASAGTGRRKLDRPSRRRLSTAFGKRKRSKNSRTGEDEHG